MLTALFLSVVISAKSAGVPVSYELPADGELPKTYLVTLAITEAKNPEWIVSTFIAGQPRIVTKENQGRFTESWDGLDENFMPVPPGEYGIKGIYSPASKWKVDGEWHAIVPKWAGGASSWLPEEADWAKGASFFGDPVNSPLRDIAVGANGVAVFYYQYLENGRQYPMFDLNKPVGPDQFLRAFPSGGAGGGTSVATDGETVWAYSTDGGHPIVFRADGKSFGSSPKAHRRNGYPMAGEVTDLIAIPAAGKTRVYVAQHRKFEEIETRKGNVIRTREVPSKTELVDRVIIHDGEDGRVLGQLPLRHPLALGVLGHLLYALHDVDSGQAISALSLKDGMPDGDWHLLWRVPKTITPFDMAVDSSGRFYLSDPTANKVYQFDASGKILRSYGRLAAQKPGAYDRKTFISPQKIATWRDASGKDRLMVVEMEGPNRVSEWSDDGKLLREFMTYQTKANNAYATDPADASLIYMPGQGDWLTRFKVDYETHAWTVDAVWPGVASGQHAALDKPVAIRRDGRLYLAGGRSFSVYRHDAASERWLQSAGLVLKDKEAFFWNDENGNGEADESELRAVPLPGKVITYHGQKWLSDFSYIAPAMGGRDVWRAAPSGFDAHGNPIFTTWEKILTDPIFSARAEGKAEAIRGGNELADTFSSDWMQADGSPDEGYYVQARGGPNFTANFGGQYKVSRYVPDAAGGYRLQWRVGRSSLQSNPKSGEIVGGMRIFKPINGILSVIDQSRAGVVLYTQEGLYVDTLFPDESKTEAGIYHQPGEFFAGTVYANDNNGKIYYASGKFTPFLYEIDGWSIKTNPVRPIVKIQSKVVLNAGDVGTPPEIALTLRGGVGKTSVVRFLPALGGAALDGSLKGWESSSPAVFESGGKSVEVRGLYAPDTLYLRWHVRLPDVFQLKPRPELERLFTHDQQTDTVGFYFQGDTKASAARGPEGRNGDVRFVFGLFKTGSTIAPSVLGLYPKSNYASARPQIYRSPVGEVRFEHAGAVPGASLGHAIDADGKGFVIAAAIPRAAIPAMIQHFGPDVRTQVNFDANLGGNHKFWWANQDGSANIETYDEPSEARLYPGSWGAAQFEGLDDGVVVRNWQVLGPFGGPGAEEFKNNPQGPMKDAVQKFYEAAVFPPDSRPLDFSATYSGSLVQGWWKDPGTISWKAATLADLDTRVIFGPSAQVWYGATWIYAPKETAVEFEFQMHPMTPSRWFLNDEPVIKASDRDYGPKQSSLHLRTISRSMTLKAGWNRVHVRAYNFGYTPFRAGLVVKGEVANLWTLGFSGEVQK